MTLDHSISAPRSTGRFRATVTRGGAGLVLAGALQAVGGLSFALLSGLDGAWSVWLVLGWPAGAIVLLVASVVLAGGLRGEDGLVGRSAGRRAALIVSGAGPLLLLVVALFSWSALALVPPALAAVQLVSFATTAAVAVTVLRCGVVTGAARWAFAVLAVVDAVALVLAVVPQASLAFQVVVALARPLAVIVAGVLLALHGRSPVPAAPSRTTA